MPTLRGNPAEPWERLKRVAAEARRHQDREAYLNIAFYLGNQYVDWVDLRDGTGHLVAVTQPREKQPGPVVNKIMHFVNSNLAQAMQSKPVGDVLPASDDPLDLGDANVANAYLKYLQEPNVTNWDKTLWDAYLWALTANSAYLKWVYNAEFKRPDIQFVPSTDLYSDPYARDFYKARWAIHSQFLDPEQVWDTYGEQVKPQSVEKADAQKTELLREMGQSPVMEGVTVNELWHKPSKRYPNGKFVVWAGRDVLHEQDFPYDHGGKDQPTELPFTQIGAIPRPFSQHCASPVTFLRAPQSELNRYHAQRLATREAWALLKLWLPEEIELQDDWDNSPNQILRGSSSNGSAPQIIGPPGQLPDNADGDWLRNEMHDIVGIHEVSEGQVPGRVEAAKAIEMLRESDTSRLAFLFATTSTTISRGFWQALMLTRQFRDDEIVVEAYSPEGVPEVHHFMSDRLKPGMRIRVAQGSGLAFSRAARLDQLTTLWTQGILRDPEAFATLADIPIPSIITTKVYDVRLARNENLTLADGKAITANSWDDHTIHLREHNNHRKTAAFAAYSDKVKQRFEHHCTEHKDLELKQLQDEAQKAMLVQQSMGAPPTGAEPAQPGANSGAAPPPEFQPGEVGPGAPGAQ